MLPLVISWCFQEGLYTSSLTCFLTPGHQDAHLFFRDFVFLSQTSPLALCSVTAPRHCHWLTRPLYLLFLCPVQNGDNMSFFCLFSLFGTILCFLSSYTWRLRDLRVLVLPPHLPCRPSSLSQACHHAHSSYLSFQTLLEIVTLLGRLLSLLGL